MRWAVIDRDKILRAGDAQIVPGTREEKKRELGSIPTIAGVSNRMTRLARFERDPVTGSVPSWRSSSWQPGSVYIPGAYGEGNGRLGRAFGTTLVELPSGKVESNTVPSTGSQANLVAALVSAGTAIAEGDPIKRVGVLQAKLDALKARGASAQRIAIMQAKLDAAKHKAGLVVESEQATRTWRSYGQGGTLVLYALGLGLLYFFVKSGQAQGRKHIASKASE